MILLEFILTVLSLSCIASGQNNTAQRNETATDAACRLRGICNINGKQCLRLSQTALCTGFGSDRYMPNDISDFINTRLKGATWKFPPRPFVDTFDFNEWFGNLTEKNQDWIKAEQGCVGDNQKWWLTWMCASLGNYYYTQNHPCSYTGVVCKSTMQDRANNFKIDLDDPQTCGRISPENRAEANKYYQLLSDLPFGSGNAGCIDGETNEVFNPQCGWLSQITACKQNCSKLTPDVASQCPQLIAEAEKRKNEATTPEQAQLASKSLPIPAIVGGILGGVALIGIAALANARRKSRPESPPEEANKVETESVPPEPPHVPSSPVRRPSYNNVAVNYADNRNSHISVASHNSNLSSHFAAYPDQRTSQVSFHASPQMHALASPQPSYLLPTQQYSSQLPQQSLYTQASTTPQQPSVESVGIASNSPLQHPPVPAIPSPQSEDFRVTLTFQAVEADEINMSLGDHAQVVEKYEDGWGFGYNLTTNQQGLFPLSCFSGPESNFQKRTASLNRKSS